MNLASGQFWSISGSMCFNGIVFSYKLLRSTFQSWFYYYYLFLEDVMKKKREEAKRLLFLLNSELRSKEKLESIWCCSKLSDIFMGATVFKEDLKRFLDYGSKQSIFRFENFKDISTS
uniref:Uncharacterized protein n=1 Tax=Tetraselmis sp. GSL018 TaxID=582737 RepID=A0A061RC18_9CHLO